MDDPPDLLVDATNVYCPDPEGAAGFYALPGMTLENAGVAIVTSATTFRGQGVFSHVDLSGNATNFEVWNGKLYRVNASKTTFTDVTPASPAIDAAVTTRVYGTSFIGQLIITDGVNKPWLATNLAATPITATAIDFDGAGTAWAAFGPFVVYGGSVFCILSSVGGVAARSDIAWSLTADASTGWQQTNYDFRWTLEQSLNQGSSPPLYALAPENTQLYYFRQASIGSLSGAVGPNLRGQATHDAISKNVGTMSPQSIVLFGDNIFFVDQLGRPYRLSQGTRELDPIWLNLRAVSDASTFGFPAVTQTVCTAAFETNLNLYIVAPWSSLPSQSGPPTEGHIFDARTGAYFGRFSVGPGVQMDTLGTFTDASGRGALIVQGSAVAPTSAQVATSGFMWSMNSLAGTGDFLTTEATPAVNLTTEDAVPVLLITEGTTVNWQDNGVTKTVSITTTRMGYDPDMVLAVDRIAALVGTTAACQVTLSTAAIAATVEGSPTPSTVQDGVSRLTIGASGIQGRGLTAKISPTTTTTQWSIQAVTASGVLSLAAPDEG